MSTQSTQEPGTAGGIPTVLPDIPTDAVLMAIYLAFAVTNMTIFQINRIKRHFIYFPTVLLFGFSMSRLVTLSLRIAWALHPAKRGVTIAAGIFANAGVLILYILNLNFAQSVLRSRLSVPASHKALIRRAAYVMYACIPAVLAMVISAAIIGGNTKSANTLRIVRDVQLAAVTFLLIFNLLPLSVLILAAFHERDLSPGAHRIHDKSTYVFALVAGLLALFNAGWKTGTAWMPPHNDTMAHLAWYHSKPAFYVFIFGLEILLLACLTAARPDLRFRVVAAEKGSDEVQKAEAGGEA